MDANNWLIKRIAQSVFTIFAVVTLSFAIIRLMPGGPADYIRAQMAQRGGGVDPQTLDQLVNNYINIEPSEPLWRQYIDYVAAAFTGDFGTSMIYNDPVRDILLGAMPWTIFVMSVSLVISFGLGVLLGALMAYIEGSKADVVLSMLSVLSTSIPYYIAAIILLMFFAYQLPLFPSSGRLTTGVEIGLTLEFFWSALYHAALPIISVTLTTIGRFALAMRGNSIQVLGEDYLRVARLRGLTQNRIVSRYVTRNAILPLYTGFLIEVGNVFGGSIILEVIFNYPGIGYYIYTAVESRDYPLLMGGFILITVAVVICLLIADLTYGKLDPRASSGGAQNEAY